MGRLAPGTLAAALLAGCGGHAIATLPPAAAQVNANSPDAMQARTGTVVIVLPPVVTGTPLASGHFIQLSSATASVAGSIGKVRIGPFPIGTGARRCTPSNVGLVCTISGRIPKGRQPIELSTYATSTASGSALATGHGSIVVYANSRTYAQSLTWTAYAKKIGVAFSVPNLVQGLARSVTVGAYGVDAGGGLIPEATFDYEPISGATIVGPTGKPLGTIRLSLSGPYKQSANVFPGQSLTFQYDGILAGTENVAAVPSSGGVRTARAKLPIVPGATTPAQLFFQAYIFYENLSTNVFQFASSAAGNVAPLRAISLQSVLVAAQSDGSFWALRQVGRNLTSLNHYSQTGTVLDAIPASYAGASPGTPASIAAAAIDAAGNAYVIDELSGQPPILNVYSAGAYHNSPQRSITITLGGQDPSVSSTMAIDGSGNAYVGYAACYSCGTSEDILEYSSIANGTAAPIRTIPIPWESGMAADNAGNIYVAQGTASFRYGAGSGLFKYAPDGTATEIEATGNEKTLISVASDRIGTLYVGEMYDATGNGEDQWQIEKFVPGTSVSEATIGGSATGFPQDTIQSSIAVVP